MACKGCGEKASRYEPKPTVHNETINGPVTAAPGFGSPPNQDPFTSFFAAKSMSYEEMSAKRDFQQHIMERQAEEIMMEMTDAMRRIHIDELIAVVNCEKMSVPGMTPEQAIVSLKETLERDDFYFIKGIYPGLQEAVDARFEELKRNRLPDFKPR